MYRIKYINFNLVPVFVRDLRGGETYVLNYLHTTINKLDNFSKFKVKFKEIIAYF